MVSSLSSFSRWLTFRQKRSDLMLSGGHVVVRIHADARDARIAWDAEGRAAVSPHAVGKRRTLNASSSACRSEPSAATAKTPVSAVEFFTGRRPIERLARPARRGQSPSPRRRRRDVQPAAGMRRSLTRFRP